MAGSGDIYEAIEGGTFQYTLATIYVHVGWNKSIT